MLKNLRGLLYNLPQANKKGDVCDGCGTFHNDAKEMGDLSFKIKHGDNNFLT